MTKLFVTIGAILAGFAVLAYLSSRLLSWYANKQEQVRIERARNTRQDISDNFQRIKDELADDSDEDKWDELEDIASGSRRR